MEQRQLGRSGVEVTRIILGCGNFGGIGSAPEFFGQGESRGRGARDHGRGLGAGDPHVRHGRRVRRRAQRAGDRRWLRERGERPVDQTKVFNPVVGDPDDRGLAPERIHRADRGEPRAARAGARRPLPDPRARPGDAARADARGADGARRARYGLGAVGASNVDGPYLEDALAISERRGLARFEWVQNSYSLLDRERRARGAAAVRASTGSASRRSARWPAAG